MKFHPARLFHRSALLAAGLLLAAALTARAQVDIDFDNDSGDYGDNQVYVMFTGAWTGTLGGSPINDYNGTAASTYSFADINSTPGLNGASGFDVTSASGDAYVIYGNTSLANFLTNNPGGGSPAPGSDVRYSYTELNYAGTTGTADITEINQFGGSVNLSNYSYNGTAYNFANSVYNTLDTGDAMRQILTATGLSASSPAVVTSGGQFVSIVGPSSFPLSVAGSPVNNPFPTYNNYLTSLHNSGSNSWLANNAGNDQGIGMNNLVLNGSNYTVGTQTWIASYNFNATVNASGDIVMNGSVSLVGASNTTGANITYNGLYIVFPNDGNQTQSLYNQNPSASTTYGNLSTANITYNGVVVANSTLSNTTVGAPTWNNLGGNFGIGAIGSNVTVASLFANATVQLKVVGDFSEGLALGFVGSTTYGNLSSAYWWENATAGYTNGAQLPGSTNFNLFGSTNFLNSASTVYNGTGNQTITSAALYTSPFDDRFTNALAPVNNEMIVTILPDGDMNVVPEPSTDALFAAGTAAIVTEFYRRRRRKLRRARRTKAA